MLQGQECQNEHFLSKRPRRYTTDAGVSDSHTITEAWSRIPYPIFWSCHFSKTNKKEKLQ